MTSQLIRFDGFYVNKSFHPKYNNYIRFYENGAALVIDANAEKHPPENVANWFYITNPKRHIWQFAVSKYETEGDNIRFYVMYAGANVEYSGIAKEDSLQFESIQKTFKNYPKELKKLEEFEFYPCQLPEEDPIKVSLAYEVFCKSVKHNPVDDAQMVWVPSGEFTMGSNDHFKDEKPQHAVFLDGFWIYKYPITVGQYRKFLASQGKQLPRLDNWEWLANHPVVKVTWEDAYNYTKWAGVELPTEAQWEKAARGGDARIYPWGNDWNKNNCAIKRKGGTVPIAALWAGQSPYGVLDMAGNVYE
ncbi:MAG: SUMF1/EgtB/PvdO family nonheme iron enzyme, partial [Blastocatellia bacterium]|nr:SUMF1/EgtB/PvdO family nonheme iron enzyme [Blastocatellia bacterium]